MSKLSPPSFPEPISFRRVARTPHLSLCIVHKLPQCPFVREPCFLLQCWLLVCFPVSLLLLRPPLASQYWTAARLSPTPLFYSPLHLVISSLLVHGNLLTAPLPDPYKVHHLFLLLGHDPFQVITFWGDYCNSPLNFPSASFLTLHQFPLQMTRGAKLWICKSSYWFLLHTPPHAESEPLLSSGMSSPVPLSFPVPFGHPGLHPGPHIPYHILLLLRGQGFGCSCAGCVVLPPPLAL